MKPFALLFFILACFAGSPAWSDDALPAMEMVRVPGGCFQMGTQVYEKHERPVHKVCLDSFEIAKYEVTQAQWRAVMKTSPSKFSECGEQCPVERISWNQAREFIRKLNAQDKGGYRLPTEAEWEYACRSGGKEENWAGTSKDAEVVEYAWFDKDAVGNQTHPVGTKKPNGLGIHDMSGNVWEWGADKFATPYPTEVENNPRIETNAEDKRVIRGGAWYGKVNYVRCGLRGRYAADFTDTRIGVRFVRDIPR
ncbi:SUMF1/EgtB/PvdO family nonheme iron enzyme [Pseudoduganella sp. FT55W]|uniref:SUMF1/EgtB/PvdO family nonheme iron enzyme n=1 Tax=Duganella rivi TaxID=2666083 RepID=A0A7X4GN96_9BURK|nr:formylglycine-generating enzyme family protein [Duganella rivi]MYM66046.1 SUMF1/EgtB/PvdO family nonheme iron enzyme [Duganella rivi]